MNKEYKCNHCDVTFSHRQSRFKHELICKKRASIKKVFRCEQCGKEYSRKDVLLKHKKRSCKGKKNKVFECSVCSKQFIRKKNLDRHCEIHLKKNYTCDICDKEYKRIDHYEMHKTKCSKLDLIETPVLIDYEDSDFMIERAYDASAVELLNEEDFDLSELSMVFNKDVERLCLLDCNIRRFLLSEMYDLFYRKRRQQLKIHLQLKKDLARFDISYLASLY